MNNRLDYIARNKTNVKLLKVDDFIKVLFTISICSGVMLNFSNVLPKVLSFVLFIVSLSAGVLSILFYVSKGGRIFADKEIKLFEIWVFLCIYMVLMGILNFTFSNRSLDFGILITMDFRYVVYWAIGFLLAKSNYISFYKKIMCYLGLLATAFGVIALIIYPYNLVAIQNRLGIWSMPYYLWWLPSAVFAYNFAYTRMTGKNKIAGYGSFFAYLILGLLFLKRVAFINCAFLFFLSLIFNPTQKTIPLKKIVFVSVMVIIAIVSVFFLFDIINDTAIYEYGKNIFENLFNRFEKDSFTSYDRAEEAIIVFNDSSSLEKIFGYGLGSYAVVNGHLYPTLHTGLFNYLYKGGVFYLGFWIYLFIQFIILFFKRKKLSKYSLACLMVAFSAILSSFYEFGFTHTIMPIGYATPIAYLIGLNRKERVYDHNLL